jgi:superfamily II DNA or RNA helicase
MQRFRDGGVSVLVATDVAARGLDVTGVDAVINYSVGGCVETYVHRIGRCGRAGRRGVAHTLVSSTPFPLALGPCSSPARMLLRVFPWDVVSPNVSCHNLMTVGPSRIQFRLQSCAANQLSHTRAYLCVHNQTSPAQRRPPQQPRKQRPYRTHWSLSRC